MPLYGIVQAIVPLAPRYLPAPPFLNQLVVEQLLPLDVQCFPEVLGGFDPLFVPVEQQLQTLLDLWLGELMASPAPPRQPVTLPHINAKWVALSMLQKGVRRGRLDWALLAASALSHAGLETTVLRRMAVICLEDLGLGGLFLLCLTLRILQEQQWSEHELRFDLIAGLLVLMCQAAKDRSACDLASVLHSQAPRCKELWFQIPEKLTDLAALLCDPEQPLLARVMAHCRLAGARSAAGRELCEDTYHMLQLPAFVRYATKGYPKQFSDKMWTALPALWDAAAHGAATADQHVLPDSPLIHGVPACALDMFTAHGKRSTAYFKRWSPRARAFFAARPDLPWQDAMGYALFAVEGGCLDRSLNWAGRDEMALETLRDEFWSVGLTLDEAGELCGLLSEDLEDLHAARQATAKSPWLVPRG